jgi:hypothetical protein
LDCGGRVHFFLDEKTNQKNHGWEESDWSSYNLHPLCPSDSSEAERPQIFYVGALSFLELPLVRGVAVDEGAWGADFEFRILVAEWCCYD